MDRVGLHATTEQFGEAFKTSKYELWHANAGARRLLEPRHHRAALRRSALQPPRQRHRLPDRGRLHRPDDAGAAARRARDFSRARRPRDELRATASTAACSSAACTRPPSSRPTRGASSRPASRRCRPKSGYARVIRDVLAWSRRTPGRLEVRRGSCIEEKWDKDDPCPDGALQPFNIDAKLNGAYVALGLLYGGGDFAKTLEIATRAGQDSDCNPSSAGGHSRRHARLRRSIPDQWKAGIPALADTKFSYTDYSFNDIVAVNARVARRRSSWPRAAPSMRAASRSPSQAPEPPPLQQWDMGIARCDRSGQRRGVAVDRRVDAAAGWRRPSAVGKDDRRGRCLGDAVVHRHRRWRSLATSLRTAAGPPCFSTASPRDRSTPGFQSGRTTTRCGMCMG